MQPTHRAASLVVSAVPNVKVRTAAQHSIYPLSLHYMLGGSFKSETFSSFNIYGIKTVYSF